MDTNVQHETKPSHNQFQSESRAEEVDVHAFGAAARQGAEALQRNGQATAEFTRRSLQVVIDGQRQIVQHAVEQLQEVSLKVAQAVQEASEGMRSLMAPPSAAPGGLEQLRQNAVSFVEDVVRTNVTATQELFRLGNPGALIALQQRVAGEYMNAFVQSGTTLARATRRAADEALRPLEQRLQQAAE